MRCSKCDSDNREGRKFCADCGAPLSVTCPKCGASNQPGEKFCGECGASLTEFNIVAAAKPPQAAESAIRIAPEASSASLDGERKTVTALFADIKGSTELMAELDPEQARAIIDPVLMIMREAVGRYDGYVVQSTGDGIFVLFGAPLAHEDHPQRALYAALRLQDAIRAYSAKLVADGGTPLEARVGIHTGEVVVRTLATADGHTEYSPIGHTANLASRMQAVAATGSIAITESTSRLVEGYFQLKPRGPTRLKGVTEPINVFEVVGLGPLRTRLQRAVGRGLTRFVGREHEMETLKRALEQSKAGHGQVVAATADPGVGKSRLFYEFKAVSHSGCMVLEAYSVSTGKASAYLPVIEMLREYFEIGSDDDDRKRRERILGKVLGLDRTLEDTLPYFYSLYRIADAGDPLTRMDPNIRRRRTLEAIKHVLLRESLNQPLIVIFEDLHWIDSETQALLNLLVDAITNARILLLVNYRPEYHHEWGGRTHYSQLRLDPLGGDSAADMLSALLGSEPELEPLKRLIADRTEGNTFFMEEMVQALFEQGVIERNGTVTIKQSLGGIRVPPTVQALLASRIDRLPPDDKAFLQTLAVLGREFTMTLIRRVTDSGENELERILANLQRGEFIDEQPAFPDTEFSFRHALTQEVAYSSVLLQRRKELHERVAQAIEDIFQPQLNEHFADLAYHYTRSGNAQNAVKYLQLAGQQALQRSAQGEALTHLNAALDLLKMLPQRAQREEKELGLQIALAAALTPIKGAASAEVESAYSRARQLARNRPDTAELVPALWGLFLVCFLRGERKAADELGEQLFSLALRMSDPIAVSIAHYVRGNNLYNTGEFAPSCQHFEQSLSVYEAHGRPSVVSLMGEELAVVCRSFGCYALGPSGYPERALRWAEEALHLARELRSPYDLALALGMAAWLHQLRREPQLTRERAEAVITVTAEQGFPGLAANASVLLGWALVQQNHPEDGIRQMLRGIEDSIEQRYMTDYQLPLLADAYRTIGQAEAGLRTLNEARELLNKTGIRHSEAELYRLEGELLMQNGTNAVQAEICFRRAIGVAQKQSAKSWELRATTSLARLLAKEARPAEACAMLAEIYNWFTEGFDTADLKEARALLEQLNG